MRILLIAYDFPPNPSPQSLRWAYLVRELTALGHEIQVITVDLPGYGPGGLPAIPSNVRIHRVYPGLFTALLLRGSRHGNTKSVAPTIKLNGGDDMKYAPHLGVITLNWKGKLAEYVKKLISLLIFPDYRAEWFPWARRRLREVLEAFGPDIVVTSHEPACSLPLGLEAKRRGYRWVADLGDPVLAPYTSGRWGRHAKRLERKVCRFADLVSVTGQLTADLLVRRHGLKSANCFVLPQGFDADFRDTECQSGSIQFVPDVLELLYTGSFYSFRRADSLLTAVAKIPGVRLNIAAASTPNYLEKFAAGHSESIRLLGFVSHKSALILQRRCDVLINLANANPVQVPGKVTEYLGAGRPIVHVRAGSEPDATGGLIEAMRVGWQVSGGLDEIEACLRHVKKLKWGGVLTCADCDIDAIACYSWHRLAEKWCSQVEQLRCSSSDSDQEWVHVQRYEK